MGSTPTASTELMKEKNMIDIIVWMSKEKEKRQSHLRLDEECIERGGVSTHYKGVLAAYLDTSIPMGRILLCHACNNAKCSNPRHLYWGTDKENRHDTIVAGTSKNRWQRLVEKYGEQRAREFARTAGIKGSKKGGLANRGKKKTDTHRRKLKEAAIADWQKRKK